MNLVIVESPTKARTIEKFLGKDYVVRASVGHVRDLPKSKLGIDVENNYQPEYEIPKTKTKVIKELKEETKKADIIYLATDEDREGEAISWHLKNILKLDAKNTKRIAFHEITENAILESLKNPRDINNDLVDAQQARRILDRIVGYKLSPFLWKKVYRGLSAGRVQSVAVRLIVEREEEREKFKKEEYWTINGLFYNSDNIKIETELIKINNKKIEKLGIKNEEEVKKISEDSKNKKYKIVDIKERETKKNPYTPYSTSTLQQDAANKLGFSAKQTMKIAQELYEGINIDNNKQTGLITYMRTDSLNLSEAFLESARNYIKNNYGEKYLEEKTRRFKTKSKSAQEAHEAIRPTLVEKSPEEIQNFLSPRQYKLYKLIWERSVATQMKQAIMKSVNINIENEDENKYTFSAKGGIIVFDGFLKVYQTNTKEKILPELKVEEKVKLEKLEEIQHFTEPKPRYSDATLIKELEENGIGRPSTYASITSTIIDRGYVERDENKKFMPTEIGRLVNKLLCEHFKDIVDIQFTANLENGLDEIAEGKKEWVPFIDNFYKPFSENLQKKDKEVDKKSITEEESEEVCDKCGSKMVIKIGRYGKFYACSNYPECKNTKPINKEEKEIDEKCPECGSPMVEKHGKYGKFYACSNYPECKYIKKENKDTGIKCPECNKGNIIEKKSRFGIFYGCSNYPECKFALWNKPVMDEKDKTQIKKCPKCKKGYLVYYGKNNKIKCTNKECK
ncbi:type I DNA topoisomerase [bacterium]|nr:type I DNA topoisomerase [bacterium]